MPRTFYTLDVFTDRPLAGNPLAVVLDSEGLDDEAMQAVAKEFNLSETVFVSPPRQARQGAAVRIFTPAHELPFAGHPTVGTAILLNHLNHLGCGDEFVLEERVGQVHCSVSGDGMQKKARFELPRISRPLDVHLDQDDVARALGLNMSDLDTGGAAVSVWDGGVPYMLVAVKTLAAVKKARPDPALLDQIEPVIGGLSANPYVFCSGGVDSDTDFHARMFAPNFGILEDPATGSAVASFSGLVMKDIMGEDEKKTFKIEQGYEMGRPSQIYLDLQTINGEIASAGISGGAVIVSDGTLHI